MPVEVECRCGKNKMTFQKLNPGDIETYDCPMCPEMKDEPKKKAQDQAPEQKEPMMTEGNDGSPEVEAKVEETDAERKAREKAEKKAKAAAEKAAKEAAKKAAQQEDKPE